MTKWYDRIGNTIEMNIDNQWVKGTIVNGYRTHDGLINMETKDGRKCGCGINGEHIYFRKCDDSLGDLLTNADRIRAMSDKELAQYICNISKCAPGYCPAYEICMRTETGTIEEWLQLEAEQRRIEGFIRIRGQYDKFINTKKGQEWKKHWQTVEESDERGDFGDYLYDFYPEILFERGKLCLK